MSPFKRAAHGLKRSLGLITLLILTSVPVHTPWAEEVGEVSVQFQGLGPNAGGVPVLGGRLRFGPWEGSLHSFNSDGLAITGAWRSIWREGSLLSPSLNLSVRRSANDIQMGPGLSLALTFLPIGPGRIGVRLDNDLFYSIQSGSFEPEYLLGFTYFIPAGGSR